MKRKWMAVTFMAILSTGNVAAGESARITPSLQDPAIKLSVPEYLLKEAPKIEAPGAKTGTPVTGEPHLSVQIGVSALGSVLSFFSNPIYVGNVLRMISGN